MKKSELISAISCRFGVPVSRMNKLCHALHGAGIVSPTRGSRRFPPELGEPEIAAIVMAALVDEGEDKIIANTSEHLALWGTLLGRILCGPPINIGHVILRNGPASVGMLAGRQHQTIGSDSDAPARIFTGRPIMALAAEIRGASPSEADAAAGILQIMEVK